MSETTMTEDASEPIDCATAPGALPLLGHFVAFRRDPLGFVDSLRAHGDLVRIRLGPLHAVVVCDPHLAHQVLTDLRTFDRTGIIYERVRTAMGNGVATSSYADHRRQRMIMQPAFHPGHLPDYASVMREQTAALVDGWHDGQVIDVVEEMFKLTTSVALRSLFTAQLAPADADALRGAFEVFLRGTATRIALPMLGRLPLPANFRYRAALRQWRTQVRELIAQYRGRGGDEHDLMARMLAARAAAGEEGGGDAADGLTDAELSDQVAVLLIAGGETTSAALSWAVYLLCTYPEVLDAARAEASRVLGEGGIAGWEHLPALELTARVIRETMRMYPPSWLVPRTTTRETRLGAHVLQAGTTVMISQYVLHHDPDVFPEPGRFDPDRWLASSGRPAPTPAVARHAYVPFGGGPTKCLGEGFAMAEAVVALASILSRWDLRLCDPSAARRPESRLVLLPRRLPVRLSARTSAP